MDRPVTTERLKRAVEACPPIVIELDACTLMTLIGQLQLALRHPRQPEATAQLTREVISRLKAQLPPVLRWATTRCSIGEEVLA